MKPVAFREGIVKIDIRKPTIRMKLKLSSSWVKFYLADKIIIYNCYATVIGIKCLNESLTISHSNVIAFNRDRTMEDEQFTY